MLCRTEAAERYAGTRAGETLCRNGSGRNGYAGTEVGKLSDR